MTRDSENWSILQKLFHLAEETAPQDRERVLAEHCADPAVVRRALDLFHGAAALDAMAPTEHAPAQPGRVGPYSLIRLLGSGGIGTVYLAERILGGAPQRVGLKMLAPHAAGPSFIERFHREQHILASLDHPNITRLIDAGLTDAGQPYLVMEYVEGEHLDVYCDVRKLSIPERLRLFLQICEAVAYAHRNLIVHLDLKPSNIMVTSEGEVKLLDFGTSKLIQTDSSLTTTVLATPAYASPEQLRNEPVTTACDVYSLGAVLAELLAGRRSTRRTSAAVMLERALSGQDPEPVENCVTPEAAPLRGTTEAKLRQTLKGDLSVITAKCQRANPGDRYRSVESLVEDLRRYLAGRPVLATPQTALYRMGKFMRRNWKAAAPITMAVLGLVGALTYAEVRQQEALREARRSVQMLAFMTQLFTLANTEQMGKPATVPDLLRLGSVVLPQMIKDPSDQRAAEISLAESMFWNGDYRDAEKLLDRASAGAKTDHDLAAEAEAEGWGSMVAFRLGEIQKFDLLGAHAVQLSGARGVTPETRVVIKTIYTRNRYELGQLTRADIALQRDAYREAHDPSVPPNDLAYAAMVLAIAGAKISPVPEQMKLAQEAVSIFRSEPWAVCQTAAAELALAYLQHQSGREQDSLATYRDSWNRYKTCRGEDSRDALVAAGHLGQALLDSGQTQEAISLLEPLVDKIGRVISPNGLELRIPLAALSQAYLREGQYQKAAELSERLFHIMDGRVEPNATQVAFVHYLWAQALAGENKDGEALQQARMADATYRSEPNMLPEVVASAKRAHQLVLDLEAKMAREAAAVPRGRGPAKP